MDTTAHAASTHDPRQRRRIVPVVDAHFQWKYTLYITALGVGLTAVMGGFLYRAHVDNSRLLDLAGNEALQEQVLRGDQIFLLYLIVLVVAMGMALAFWGLVVTHRISGPLYIVARYLGVLSSGQYPDMRPLRKKDELHEFFASFEEAINAMRNRDIAALRDFDQILTDIKRGESGDAKAALQSISKIVQQQRNVISDMLGGPAGSHDD